MGNYKQLLCLLFLFAFCTLSCTKESNVAEPEAKISQTSGPNPDLQSVTYNNITIDSSQTHVFAVPGITQYVIENGSVTVYATQSEEEPAAWSALPIIHNCDSRLEVISLTAGKVEIQNTLGVAIAMSFRFDIFSNQP